MGIFIDKKSSDNVSNPSEFSIKTIFTKLEFLMRKIFHYLKSHGLRETELSIVIVILCQDFG